jgi:hypothetical protein
MATDQDVIAVVSKLNRLTQEEKLNWESREAPKALTTATDDRIVNFYGATYKKRNLGIYEERYQSYDPEFDRPYWAGRLVLALFSDDWRKEWEFPHAPGISELFQSVQYQVADIGGTMNDFLKDEES